MKSYSVIMKSYLKILKINGITSFLLAVIFLLFIASAILCPSKVALAIEPCAQFPSQLLVPGDFQYLGAFRLPDAGERPLTFEYGGNAMTFRPDGDPTGPNDGFTGSLFIMGHDRLPYGELPNGNQVAEVTIPVPVASHSLSDLNTAQFLQNFHDIAEGHFTSYSEIPRVGMEYLNNPLTGPKIHLAWGQHFHEEPSEQTATHAWIDPNLGSPNFQGTWFIGYQSLYSVNGYLFAIPTDWADAHTSGRPLATGRYRDGGWSGMGPALFAYKPWDSTGAPEPDGTHLSETVLLLYAKSNETEQIEHCLNGYQHTDEWEGGAWLTTPDGKTAVLFAGTKGVGHKYWYGFVNPNGPEYPCVAQDFVGQFTVCRNADGTPCPESDLVECSGHNYDRGWWSSAFQAQFILYNPDDLAKVASGAMNPWEPQPYASINIDPFLFLNPEGIEPEMLGTGVQRRFRIGAVAYDRGHGLLYVLELFADEAKPVVHVWRIQSPTSSYSITLAKQGTGLGTVISNPAGINCGNTCSASFNEGTTVTLTPTPGAGSMFSGWGGDCSPCGTNTTCQVIMDADKSCTAGFTTGVLTITHSSNATSFQGGMDYNANHLELAFERPATLTQPVDLCIELQQPAAGGGSLYCWFAQSIEGEHLANGIYFNNATVQCDSTEEGAKQPYCTNCNMPDTLQLYGPSSMNPIFNDGWVVPHPFTMADGEESCQYLPHGDYAFSVSVYETGTTDLVARGTVTITLNRGCP